MTTTTTTTMKMKERIIYKFFVRKFSSFLSQKATRTTKVTEKRAEEARAYTHTQKYIKLLHYYSYYSYSYHATRRRTFAMEDATRFLNTIIRTRTFTLRSSSARHL